ncbi:protein disabled [Agrilus planipennis]|uniref:Protein disabled n=1 Tax=Agrilus planipennis TaxID=224129 RepID=A0A7F5R4A2_AGRPL|nr:protein disabled [Agrilus planipennis]
MTDSRAFGYIFGSPDTGHRFFGIKTDKAASQVVIAMRDLFQVVFALKKKEIELAKQNLEKNYGFNRDNSNVIPESVASDSRDISCSSTVKNSSALKSHSTENKSSTPVVANLVDLEIELTNLQQGISQIERLTPSNDPFEDSFISYTPKPFLPPPPGRERSYRAADATGNSSSKAQTMTINKGSPSQMLSLLQSSDELTLIKSHNESHVETVAEDWFISSVTGTATTKDSLTQSPLQKDLSTTLQSERQEKQDVLKQFDVFTELDPLGKSLIGTGKIKPYIHKRDFFQDLKKPKKVLNDLVNDKQTYSNNISSCSTNVNESFKSECMGFATDPFGEDPFVKSNSFAEKDPFSKNNFNVDFAVFKKEQGASDLVDDMVTLAFSNLNEDSFVDTHHLEGNIEKDIKLSSEFDSEDYKKMSPDSDNAPKPPPRPTNNILTQPPPLPPKKQPGDLCIKPPPRPPHSDDSHYDVISKEARNDTAFSEKGPPLPSPARKAKSTQFSFEQQKKTQQVESSEDDYLTPISFPSAKDFSYAEKKCFLHKSADDVSTNIPFFVRESSSIVRNSTNMSLADINFMLSQLTLSGLNELATELNIPSVKLSNMTLAQITNYLSGVIKNLSQDDDSKQQDNSDTSKVNFADFSNFNTNETHDKYAVFRELEATEFKVNVDNNMSSAEKNGTVAFFSQDSIDDKYAALREITDENNKKSEYEDLKNEPDFIFEESFDHLSQKSDQTRNESGGRFVEKQLDMSVEKQHMISQSSSDDKRESPKQFERIDDVFEEEKLQTFDSISEGASGTSPENDAATEAIKRVKRSDKDWTVFDQTKPQVVEKLSLQSEEGVSPWSSDSKEFGNASPPEWKEAVNSGGGRWIKQASLKDQEKWWDNSAEPEEYYQPNRRSIDSFEDEYCTYSKTLPGTKKKQITGSSPGSQAAGGHSSSSRDISPWEEEAYKLTPAQRRNVRTSENWERHSKQYLEKCRDSWDEEDDYEYDAEQYGRYYWPDRHASRQIEKVGYSRRMKEHWTNERHLWKQELERKRHCCEDWELENTVKSNRYYCGNKRSNEGVCSHKWTSNYEDPHFIRDSQDSSWEEDYHQNSSEMQSSHYINLKHRWKRPSSASEVEKNTDEIRKQVQYYVGTAGENNIEQAMVKKKEDTKPTGGRGAGTHTVAK